MSNEGKRKVFLIVSGHSDRLDLLTDYIGNHYDKPVIYRAPNGNVGLLKAKNAVIDVVITDSEINTPDSMNMIEMLLLENLNPHMAVINIGSPPEEEKFIDELMAGKLHFLDTLNDNAEFAQTLARALNYTTHTEAASFYLRYLACGDILIKEGDKAEFVYILKSGQLQAFNMIEEKKIILGNIEIGEFVGEMAYINNEPRSATIEALSDTQLIEVPIELVDQLLYKRPAWSKAMMQSLSKRLKSANKSNAK